VEWRAVGLAYRSGLPLALRGLTCTIRDGERVGVCGRTGAGKSSITVALLRLADVISGQIIIGGVDHATVPLAVLRARLALISQEATLFAGTVRLNLDPEERHADAALLAALGRVGLAQLVNDAGGLGAAVAEDGGNWSSGQRQLLSIARGPSSRL
jgi:ABC-type multidrug transport system fused ATPase/permease subunit